MRQIISFGQLGEAEVKQYNSTDGFENGIELRQQYVKSEETEIVNFTRLRVLESRVDTFVQIGMDVRKSMPNSGKTLSGIMLLDPEQARQLAEQLLRIADAVDNTRKKQS